MKSILDFARARLDGRPITVVTAYDVLMARAVAASEADAILVGDSVAMVVHGHPSTVHATIEMMCLHTAAVRRGAPELLVIADLPFLTTRRGIDQAVDAAGRLIQAGANAVKIEGIDGHAGIIRHLVASGIPVMGHLGLRPQSINQLGGYRFQGRSPEEAAELRRDGVATQQAGAFGLVLECVPEVLAGAITAELSIPTIGIGAGAGTSGQVLVLTDLLGLDPDFRPRFARRYLDGHQLVVSSLNRFVADVRGARFPAREEVSV
ncbi:MAG TPA: 3-methyl-2-oxobutanoate hydroxymethyltransferase [Candidatus Didemnitutus sp.]|nr:3-methyl-2-oxobutanoate hydroxymethyltransferase [Candidatus Didemnitutus sp.]